MIYADYNGSSPLLKSVQSYLKQRLDSDLFANPNAIHSIGQKVSRGIEKCRELIASVVGCYPDQIIFNSGASEGISHILHSILKQTPKTKNIILTAPIEHSVIPNALDYYAKSEGFTLNNIEIDSQGVVSLKHLEELLSKNHQQIALVTVMAANNETGVIQPYQEVAKLCHKFGVEYFCDTTQLIGKGEFHFETSGLDYAVCSGHKVGALSGSGFMIVREPTKLLNFVFGSSQERGLRGGTQHYLGIETLAVALKDFEENVHLLKSLKAAKLVFEEEIRKKFPKVQIIGANAERLAGTTLISYPGIHGQAIQIELESENIFVTTSAACTDNQPETSKILVAMGINDQIGRGVVRISLSYSHKKDDYNKIAYALENAYSKLTRIQSY